jgi:hypothetical protein
MGYHFDDQSSVNGMEIGDQSWQNHFQRIEALATEGGDEERLCQYQHFL